MDSNLELDQKNNYLAEPPSRLYTGSSVINSDEKIRRLDYANH